MKKKLLILLAIIVVITGCGTKDEKEVNTSNVGEQTTEKEETKNEVKEEEAKDITKDKTVETLMEKIRMPLNSSYYSAYYTDKLMASDLKNDAKILLGSMAYERKHELPSKMTKEDMKKELVEIFGKDVSYKDENISTGPCFGQVMSFNGSTYTYEGGCGGVGPVNAYETKVIEAKEYSDRIEIVEKVAYLSYTDWDIETGDCSRDVLNKEKGEKIDSEKNVDVAKFDIDKYLDKLDSYKYTFNKEGDNYYFYSVEKVK